MALIFCENCGKQISDKATACPHCRMPLAAPAQNFGEAAPMVVKKGSKAPWIVAVVAVIGAVGAVTAVLLTRGSDDKGVISSADSPVNSMIVFDNNSSESSVLPVLDSTPSSVATTTTASTEVSPTETQPSYYTVSFDINIEHNSVAAKYLVDFYIDNEWIATLDEGNFNQAYRLAPGVHTISLKDNDHPNSNRYSLVLKETITDNCTVNYHIKRRTWVEGGIDMLDRSIR